MPPGTNPPMVPASSSKNTSKHPRRAPADKSVSLLHSPRKLPPRQLPATDISNEPSKGDSDATDDSPSSLQPLGAKGSSGESSNAERWFEKSNNDVQDSVPTFADNEPPYFLRNNSSSSDTSPERRQLAQIQRPAQLVDVNNDGVGSLPQRAGLLHLGTEGSSNDGFRGVIDDLTIENKKLKRKLKKYEKLHDAHLKDEKLFEVRIHGLSAEKKRELEETLRKFAGSLQPSEFPANGYEGLLPMLKTHKTASSQTSIHNTDSAYASMSASGQGSSAHSAADRTAKTSNSATRQSSIHTYLHHIPEGLLPQHNPAHMTEKAKKRLVVRRLEQIFSGKGATSEGHQQPLQQQEVSQSAARADRSANEARGQAVRQEGHREALIMPRAHEEGDAADQHPAQILSPKKVHEQQGLPTTIVGNDFANVSPQAAVDQRPTRPLDLDPYRAQVPAENIRYMRHLGFSPPDPASHVSPSDGHGWIYLNFLINMAQLHTINVTSDFVRKSITELSTSFEISPDGRKVRWLAGRGVTRKSSETGALSNDRLDGSLSGPSPRKRPKLTHRNSNRSAHGPGKESSRFAYTPLFFHKDSTDDSDDSSSEEEVDDDDVLYPAPVIAGDSSGMTSSGIRTTSTKKSKKVDEGPIIYYNNARFCTDLSGERKPMGGNPNAPPYTPISVPPIGKPQLLTKVFSEKRGPLAQASELPEAMDLGDNPIPQSMELAFPVSSPLESDSDESQVSINMEVTGMGGVWPSDHFAINVQSRQARVDAPSLRQQLGTKSLPPKLAKILRGDASVAPKRQAIRKEVVSSRRTDLAPSTLPPALCFMPFGGEDSLSDDESEADEEMSLSLSEESHDAFPPSAAPQPLDLQYGDSGEETDGEDEDDDESEGSLDLLAAAREVDPEAVRAREREYDANIADRLAEEIPAGSSAATAGGGSGFNTPASGTAGHDVQHAEYQRAKREARPRPASLKQARTTDDTQVQGADSEDEDMDDARS